MTVAGEGFDQLVPRRAGGHGDNRPAWDRHIVGIVFAEMQEVAQHLPLDRREVAADAGGIPRLFLVLGNRFLKLLAQALVGLAPRRPVEQAVQPRPDPFGPTVRLSCCLAHTSSIAPLRSRSPYGSAIPSMASAFISSASIASASAAPNS